MNKKKNNILEHKFIIPAKKWYTVNYEKQIDEPQRVKELNIKANSKVIIIIRTNSKFDLEIYDSQYQFNGDKTKNPSIVKYENPYYKKPIKWFDDEVFDWHGILHLKGKRKMFKDVTYVDGFEIQTYEKGRYCLNMEFIALCKGKSQEIRTSQLFINVI